jgi:muconolactone delta-isomerase
MKFLVITTRKAGVKLGLQPKDLHGAFKGSVDYFTNLEKNGKIVSMGGFTGQHGSYKIFNAESKAEVDQLLKNAPLSTMTDDAVHQIVEFNAVLDNFKHRMESVAQKA